MDLIIGGGVTGLSYALFSSNEYLILEKDQELGGYCRTIHRNGYTWDYSGHFFHFRDESVKQQILTNLISKGEIIAVTKNTNIKYKNKFIDFPFQKNIHQLNKTDFIDCLVELFNPIEGTISSFKSMLYNKYGKGICDRFLIPYNEKLYACDLDLLDKDAMGRFFPHVDKEEIIRNFKVTNNSSYNNNFIYPKGGAIEYISEIFRQLDSNKIRTGCEVKKINIEAQEVQLNTGETIHYDRLISTIPFPKLLKSSGLNFNEKLYSWNQVLVFNLGFDTKGPQKKLHWIYFPEKKYCFYRVGFYDNILNQDRSSLYVELGFKHNEEVNPEKWLKHVLTDLVKANIITKDQKLIDHEVILMNPAYVHISQNSQDDVKQKKENLAKKNIYSIGRYGSWTYCSIEDNILEAKALALKLNHNNHE